MSYLKKDDPVIVLSGNNRGMKGQVLRVIGDKIVVQGINVKKKHVKPTKENPKGSVLSVERPIHISNVALEVGGRPRRLRVRTTESGDKEACYKDGDTMVVYRTLKKGR